MAELAKKQLRKKRPELEVALEGRVEEHHHFLLKLQLDRLESVEKDLEVLEQRMQQKLDPYAAQLDLLDEIPGVETFCVGACLGPVHQSGSAFLQRRFLVAVERLRSLIA